VRRIAALHDVHGNLPALEAVLSEVESAQMERIRTSGWPTAEEFVRENLLTVPAATAAIGHFERMAGRG
jgi:hypothetical protein